MVSGIQDFGIQNRAQVLQNPTKAWNPESTFHWKRLESSTRNPQSTEWDPESKTVLYSLTWGDSTGLRTASYHKADIKAIRPLSVGSTRLSAVGCCIKWAPHRSRKKGKIDAVAPYLVKSILIWFWIHTEGPKAVFRKYDPRSFRCSDVCIFTSLT